LIEAFNTIGRAGSHKRQRFLHREQKALDIHVERIIEECFRHLLQGSELPCPGVDEQGVNPAESLANRCHCVFNVRDLAGVRLDCQCARSDLFGCRLQRLIVTPGDSDRSALAGIGFRDPKTYPFVAACYNRYSFFEPLSVHTTSFGTV
jgi:hypothetical protein